MGISIKINVKSETANVASKIQKIASNKALGTFLASEAAKGMDKYVPKRTGYLAGSESTSPFKVTYNAPYAVYVYNGRGMNFAQDKHPNATAKWDRAYAIADGSKLGKAGTKFLKGL